MKHLIVVFLLALVFGCSAQEPQEEKAVPQAPRTGSGMLGAGEAQIRAAEKMADKRQQEADEALSELNK
jgi:hypothetical protein